MSTLSSNQIDEFVELGFVRVDNAIPRPLVDECTAILWRDPGCDPNDPRTWTRPVIRLGDYAQQPFAEAANTPALRAGFDALVGAGRWVPRASLGTFPIRFPSADAPGDDGWHVDASFPGENPSDYFTWRVNVHSRGRALLVLFLFSDVGEHDAPTRIRIGSHLDVARILEPAGDAGFSFTELAQRLDATSHCPQTLAIGDAGTVYLCHPFLVHAAQVHRGGVPRIMAQPPLLPAEGSRLNRVDDVYSPVERAIRVALGISAAGRI